MYNLNRKIFEKFLKNNKFKYIKIIYNFNDLLIAKGRTKIDLISKSFKTQAAVHRSSKLFQIMQLIIIDRYKLIY